MLDRFDSSLAWERWISVRAVVLGMTVAMVLFVPAATPVAAAPPDSTDECPDALPGENEVAGGDAGNITLTGTDEPDLICGEGGNDTITGLGGNDRIYGGPGDDLILDGGEGNDLVAGGSGNDGNGGAGGVAVAGGTGGDGGDGNGSAGW